MRPCVPPLGRVQSRRGHREVPHCWLSIHRFDQLHAPVAADWAHGPRLPCGPLRWREDEVHSLSPGIWWRDLSQQDATLRELCLAHQVGQEAEVAEPVEAVRWDMEHQTAQEFHGLDRQGTQAVATLVILVAEGHQAILQGDETVIGEATQWV